MKKAKIVFILTVISIFATLISCNKTDSGSTPLPSTPSNEAALLTELSQNASDQSNVQNDEDFIEDDVQRAVAVAKNFNGILPGSSYDDTTLPNAVIDMSSLSKTNKVVKVGYTTNTPINGIAKIGTITIQLVKGSKWSDQGAEIMEKLDSIRITYNGITRIYQSTRYITNLLGGVRYLVSQTSPYIYSMHSYGTVTFPDNTVSSYWITRKNSLINSSNSATLPTIFSSDGDTTVNGDTCTMGGISRSKSTFRVKDSQTYAASVTCGYFKPYLGIRSFIAGDTVKITFGVTANGNQSGSNTTPCDSLYGYKIEWTKLSGQPGLAVVKY